MKRVLIVEDSTASARLFRVLVEQLGHAAEHAESVAEASARLAVDQLPDAILLDLGFPGEDGRDLLAALKRDPRTASVPVLIVSASGFARDVADGREAGAIDYVTKPISTQALSQKLREILG